jgi:hypothetical protein
LKAEFDEYIKEGIHDARQLPEGLPGKGYEKLIAQKRSRTMPSLRLP